MVNIGIISWNIGNNVNQDKMNELVEAYLSKNDKNHPDILVIGFQELPLYKLKSDKKVYSKIQTYLSNALGDTYESIKNTSGNLPYTCSDIRSGGFGIGTFIFSKNNLNVTLEKVDVYCPLKTKQIKLPIIKTKIDVSVKTKGFCVCKINIEDKSPAVVSRNPYFMIDVVNTHMPFTTDKESNSFYTEIEHYLETHGYTNRRIVFGDLNSRSLLTKECYSKNVTPCNSNDSNDSNDYFCDIKNRLEEKKDLNPTIKYFTRGEMECGLPKAQKDCKLNKPVSEGDDELVKLLIKRDFVGNPPKKCVDSPFAYYNEGKISFLPTYKRNESTGLFSLEAKKKGRLPGYADRIIFDGDFISNRYTPLEVKGNDHLPLSDNLSINISGKKFTPVYSSLSNSPRKSIGRSTSVGRRSPKGRSTLARNSANSQSIGRSTIRYY
jgi:hypothetical protein